jgi:hypothetical protein
MRSRRSPTATGWSSEVDVAMKDLDLRTIVLASLLCGCATNVRFEDAPIVWYADDRRDIPQPEPTDFSHIGYLSDMIVMRRSIRTLELRDLEPARDVNALDEVPNSTWFTNRIGVRTVTPEEAARGAVVDGPPRLPLVVEGGKTGGRNLGFRARDASGRRFVVKFDLQSNPDLETAADVIVSRIFWTIGYNVPQDTLVRFRREDLRLAPDAEVAPRTGKPRRMTERDLDELLAESPRQRDGSVRASASQLLDGVALGGVRPEGVRKDDPNDTVRHEQRRVLRGLRVFAAWLSHTDVKEDNFVDMYVEENGRRFVRHHLVDFGEALGAHQAETGRMEDGFEYVVDWEKNGLAALSLGLWERPWERQRQTRWPSIGAFSAEPFDPVRWREAYPFFPFFEMDRADAFWAAKIVMRFDRPLLEAIVQTGELPEDASAYLVDTLLDRARQIGMAWLEPMTALDAFHVRDGRLCAYDLAIVHGLASGGTIEQLGRETRVLERFAIAEDGRVCLPLPADDRYTVLRLRTRRGEGARPVMQVHVVGGERARVLGILRTEGGPCMRGRGLPRCG